MRQGMLWGAIACAVMLSATPAHGQAPAAWTTDASPLLRLGSDNATPDYFQTVVGATRLPSGDVLVGDRGDYALRHYNPAGTLIRRFGRKGGGPGEIRSLARLWRCGDSVYTYDVDNGHRISVFTLSGRYVREFRFSGPRESPLPYQSACGASGLFAHLGWDLRKDRRPGAFRSVVPLWTSRAMSGVLRVIDAVPGSERWDTSRGDVIGDVLPMPLGRQPVLGVGRRHVFVGTSDDFSVKVLDFAGRRVGTLRRTEAPTRRSAADLEALLDHQTAGRSGEARARLARFYAEIELPETLPAYTALVVDALDLVWIKRYARPGATVAGWSVFSPTGALVAEAALPGGLEVYEIGSDYVLGRAVDEAAGTPEVHVYRLTRGTSGRR